MCNQSIAPPLAMVALIAGCFCDKSGIDLHVTMKVAKCWQSLPLMPLKNYITTVFF